MHRYDYTPKMPENVVDVFSASGKQAIGRFKLQLFAESIATDLIVKGLLEEVIDGGTYHIQHNCKRLRPYVAFPSPRDELEAVKAWAHLGLEAVVDLGKEQDIFPSQPGKLHGGVFINPDDSSLIDVKVSYSGNA